MKKDKYKEAVDFMYQSIGRDYGSLEPLEAARAWMDSVLSECTPSVVLHPTARDEHILNFFRSGFNIIIARKGI